MEIAGSNALVTGGAAVIGRAIAVDGGFVRLDVMPSGSCCRSPSGRQIPDSGDARCVCALTMREMRFALVLLLEAIAVASLTGAGWSTWRAASCFQLWYWPLFEAGELPAGGRLPALETWQRLLGERAEDELVAEQRRRTTKLWTIRAAKFGSAFFAALALSAVL